MLLNKLNKCLHKPRGLVSSFLTPVGYKGITSVKRMIPVHVNLGIRKTTQAPVMSCDTKQSGSRSHGGAKLRFSLQHFV